MPESVDDSASQCNNKKERFSSERERKNKKTNDESGMARKPLIRKIPCSVLLIRSARALDLLPAGPWTRRAGRICSLFYQPWDGTVYDELALALTMAAEVKSFLDMDGDCCVDGRKTGAREAEKRCSPHFGPARSISRLAPGKHYCAGRSSSYLPATDISSLNHDIYQSQHLGSALLILRREHLRTNR